MDKNREFIARFEIPPAIAPFVKVFADPQEIDLIIAMAGRTCSVGEVADLLDLTFDQAADLLERAYRRHFVHREVAGQKVGYIFDHVDAGDKPVRYIPARFYDRLDELSMYGDWDEIPEAVREAVTDWWLKEYTAKIAPVVEKIKADPDAYQKIKQKDFLLLEEALAQVEAAEVHAVVNCDCRSSTQACSRMVEACIRLDDGARYTLERGLGREVSKEECKQIVLATDRDGLMHIGTRAWQGHGLFGFCNCCTCCCFPLRSSALLDSDRIYPRVHHLARRDADACTHCGLCVKRCQFGAFSRGDKRISINGKRRKAVLFDPAKCYGCGICMTG
ncbi:MAG TPA: 4Fe-4S binding protein, partial [Desulfosarcina sp.]|nr:4Fe-4S binding protein [Desulfosarcina sp.]